MIYYQQSHLPIIFQVDEDIIGDVDYYLRRNKLAFTNILVASGASHSYQYAKEIARGYNLEVYVIKDNSFSEVERLKQEIFRLNTDLVIGVGGGKVIDTVKRASYLSNINNLSIPTIIANDGLISPIAVIKNESGKTQSLPGMMPMGVIIDINVIKHSPDCFIRAAIGDVFSNLSATNDWILAFKEGREQINDIAFHLSKSGANSLIHFEDFELKSKSFLRMVVQGLVNSGIAMSLAGTSRPCSGSEHLISHAIDYLGYSSGALHGIQVASASLFTLSLQGKLKKKHLDFAKLVGIPLDFGTVIDFFSKERFSIIIDKARHMRPGRYTVLDRINNTQIFEKYKEFQTIFSK